jgi:hypothetical protein
LPSTLPALRRMPLGSDGGGLDHENRINLGRNYLAPHS